MSDVRIATQANFRNLDRAAQGLRSDHPLRSPTAPPARRVYTNFAARGDFDSISGHDDNLDAILHEVPLHSTTRVPFRQGDLQPVLRRFLSAFSFPAPFGIGPYGHEPAGPRPSPAAGLDVSGRPPAGGRAPLSASWLGGSFAFNWLWRAFSRAWTDATSASLLLGGKRSPRRRGRSCRSSPRIGHWQVSSTCPTQRRPRRPLFERRGPTMIRDAMATRPQAPVCSACSAPVPAGPDAVACMCWRCTLAAAESPRAQKPAGKKCPDCGAVMPLKRARFCDSCRKRRRTSAYRAARNSYRKNGVVSPCATTVPEAPKSGSDQEAAGPVNCCAGA